MYRWQTLTLARIESNLGNAYPDLLTAARDFLLDIGLRYCPEPTVDYPPRTADSKPTIWLTWKVDDRDVRAEFDSSGFVGMSHGHYDEGSMKQPHSILANLSRHDMHEMMAWLLNGVIRP